MTSPISIGGVPGWNCQASPPSESFTSFGARSWNFFGEPAGPDVGRLEGVGIRVDQPVLAHGVLLGVGGRPVPLVGSRRAQRTRPPARTLLESDGSSDCDPTRPLRRMQAFRARGRRGRCLTSANARGGCCRARGSCVTSIESGRMRAAVYREKRRLVVEERPVPRAGTARRAAARLALRCLRLGPAHRDGGLGPARLDRRSRVLRTHRGARLRRHELGARCVRGGRAGGRLRSLRILRDAPAELVREPRHAGRLRVPGSLRGVRARARVAAAARPGGLVAARGGARRAARGGAARRHALADRSGPARAGDGRGARSACSRSRRCGRRASTT